MNKQPKFNLGDMVKIVGSGQFDCPALMIESCCMGQQANDKGQPISPMGWWYLWNRYYPYPVSEEHVFKLDDGYQPSWDTCVWKPSKEVVHD